MAINREFLLANHADLAEAFRAEGRSAGLEQGRQEGMAAERARILAIDAAAVPGHEQLTAQAKKDGMEPGEYAQRVLAAEKVAREQASAALAADAPKPAPAAEPAETKGTMKRAEFDALSPVERMAKAKAGVKLID